MYSTFFSVKVILVLFPIAIYKLYCDVTNNINNNKVNILYIPCCEDLQVPLNFTQHYELQFNFVHIYSRIIMTISLLTYFLSIVEIKISKV